MQTIKVIEYNGAQAHLAIDQTGVLWIGATRQGPLQARTSDMPKDACGFVWYYGGANLPEGCKIGLDVNQYAAAASVVRQSKSDAAAAYHAANPSAARDRAVLADIAKTEADDIAAARYGVRR